MIYESFVPDSYYRNTRSLARTRIKFIRVSTEEKNMMHAILAKHDHKRPKCGLFTRKGEEWMRSVGLFELDRMAMDAHLDMMETADRKAGELASRMAAIGIADNRVKIIMTMPGTGHLIALSIIAEIVDVARFATAEKLVSYAGISPWLRNAMVDAATVATRFDPRMKAIYERIAKWRGKQKVKVAVARHMLEIIWHMLTAMQEYRTKNDEMTQRKYKLMERVSKAT